METTSTHPVSAAIAAAQVALGEVAQSPVWSLPGAEIAADLGRLAVLAAQVAELELRLVFQAEASGIAGDAGATSAAVLWSSATCQDRAVAKRRADLARALDGPRVVTREAMCRGEVSEAQARVIVDAVAALEEIPSVLGVDIDASIVERAEKDLVRLAGEHPPRELRVLGRRILDVVAPEVGEEAERAALQREEEAAAAAARFTMSSDGHGQVHGRFTLPTLHGDMLRTMLAAVWTPHLGDGPRGQGRALMEVVERYPADVLPEHGGVAATVTVTMTHRELVDALDAAGVVETGLGTRITAGEARRLACGADLVPAVLGGASSVLDVGRRSRFHTRPQRVAIALRDKTCTAEGCDYPPGLCHVHHDDPWSTGGHTSVAKGRLLCPRHHRMIHAGHHEISISKHGRLIFRRT
ncbi:HNH endonuclease [Marmoricola endophyticus]|uniref:HNH endonuclease n=1 Tax=Marmoricola endophyticus TaxID=2040280 RepID=A0A917BLY3_9ACTN|nr:HNH endonuclease signature motif containing protein [Marmoricola endophyticus]GGF46151.1 HNH endonuclease [Marmoricola endophyticus]